MLLHEAVRKARRKARQELHLSQKKLAEQAGIQRRQLATLEKGGNVTLATLRKVIAQLPNLESFTIDAVNVNVNFVPTRVDQDKWDHAMRALASVFGELADSLHAGHPSMATVQALQEVNTRLPASVVPDARGGKNDDAAAGGGSRRS